MSENPTTERCGVCRRVLDEPGDLSTAAETFELPTVQFEFEARVGLVVSGDNRTNWLSWDETVKLVEWLAPLVEAWKSR